MTPSTGLNGESLVSPSVFGKLQSNRSRQINNESTGVASTNKNNNGSLNLQPNIELANKLSATETFVLPWNEVDQSTAGRSLDFDTKTFSQNVESCPAHHIKQQLNSCQVAHDINSSTEESFNDYSVGMYKLSKKSFNKHRESLKRKEDT